MNYLLALKSIGFDDCTAEQQCLKLNKLIYAEMVSNLAAVRPIDKQIDFESLDGYIAKRYTPQEFDKAFAVASTKIIGGYLQALFINLNENQSDTFLTSLISPDE